MAVEVVGEVTNDGVIHAWVRGWSVVIEPGSEPVVEREPAPEDAAVLPGAKATMQDDLVHVELAGWLIILGTSEITIAPKKPRPRPRVVRRSRRP